MPQERKGMMNHAAEGTTNLRGGEQTSRLLLVPLGRQWGDICFERHIASVCAWLLHHSILGVPSHHLRHTPSFRIAAVFAQQHIHPLRHCTEDQLCLSARGRQQLDRYSNENETARSSLLHSLPALHLIHSVCSAPYYFEETGDHSHFLSIHCSLPIESSSWLEPCHTTYTLSPAQLHLTPH